MVFEKSQIEEISEIITMLIEEEDLSSKIETALKAVLVQVNPNIDSGELLKIQDDLEHVSNMNNLNEFCRTELMNLVADIDSIINS
ncbi:MAG: hypothetical protein HRU03_07730 [Nanoarchaeales archaeon]|nr:hypothetical protein [Nanoarchaeales archaeon]